METTTPYRTPIADVTAPRGQGLDHTRPFDPSGRFGRLSYIAWAMLATIGLSMNPELMQQWQQALQAA